MEIAVGPVEQRRKQLGLSQVELANAARVSQPTISAIEAGHTPRLTIAYAVAAALGQTIEDLFPQAVAS